MINIEELLKPISPEEPCGVDISYDPATQELETLLLGKPEAEFGATVIPAEEPPWEAVRNGCLDLLRRSKNLRVALVLCLALLRCEGLPGFRDGLVLMRRLLEQYWDTLFPRLDPEDHNDPTERVNILASFVIPLGTIGDPMQFLRKLREAKLTDSKKVGRFSLEEMAPTPGAAVPVAPVDPGQVQAAFRDTAPESLEKVASAVSESMAAANAIDEFLTKTIGAGRAVDWKPLIAALNEIRKVLAPFVAQTESVPGEAEAGGTGAGAAPPASSGAIQSREDVVRMLDRICEYYSQAEPSSPVPLMLRRAQRLAAMNFIEIIEDLSPEALSTVHNVTGTKAPSVPAAS